MRLLLVRHAETPANVDGVIATDRPGPGLTDTGRRQSLELVSALAAHELSSLSVSPLIRTHETAAPLAEVRALVPIEHEGLEEIRAGSIEGRRDAEAVSLYVNTLRTWGQGDLAARMPDSESGVDFFARFDAAIARIATEHGDDDTAVVFSHGAAIRVWVGGRARNISPGFVGTHHLDNTGVVELSGDPDRGWLLDRWMGERAPHGSATA